MAGALRVSCPVHRGLDADGEEFGTLPDLLGRAFDPLGQEIPDAGAHGDLAQQVGNAFKIGERNGPADPAFGDQAFFEAFDGPGDHRSGRNGVDAELIAQVVGIRHFFDARQQAVAAEKGDGFIFRPFDIGLTHPGFGMAVFAAGEWQQ